MTAQSQHGKINIAPTTQLVAMKDEPTPWSAIAATTLAEVEAAVACTAEVCETSRRQVEELAQLIEQTLTLCEASKEICRPPH